MNARRMLVTGAAGFIGSNLCDRLLADGCEVVGVDSFATGFRHFLSSANQNPQFRLVELDLLDAARVTALFEKPFDTVFHLAANADVRDGLNHPRRDLEQNLIATSNLLEGVRTSGTKRFVFSSTGSVYGEAKVIPTPEDCPFPIQTSLYGASKLAAEGLIAAYAEGYGISACVFRFVSILGERYTHGHVYDFVKSLKADPTRLRVLGNGKQRKSYLYVKDCVQALVSVPFQDASQKYEVFNLGTDEYCEVNDSVRTILSELKLDPRIEYTGGDRGWVGDNPFIWLDCSKARSRGWAPTLSIESAIRRTVDYLRADSQVFEIRQ